MDRPLQHDETDEGETPYLGEERDYRELNFNGDDDTEFSDDDLDAEDDEYL